MIDNNYYLSDKTQRAPRHISIPLFISSGSNMTNLKLLWSLLLFLCGSNVGLLHGIDSPLRIVSYSEDPIVRENGPLTVFCHGNLPYSMCKFTLPQGTVCTIKGGESEKDCGNNGARFNKTNPNFCALDIQSASSNFNGIFKCEIVAFDDEEEGNVMSDSQEIDVVVSSPADVEFNDIYGSVTVIVNKQNNFTCTAEYGRPVGEFLWRLGEEGKDDAVIFANESPMNIMKDENNYYNVSQSLWYNPEIEHNAKNLYCIYNQKDHNGEVLYSTSDHISFDVYYLNEPEAATIIPKVDIGEDFHISYVFGSYPKPKIEDIIWRVKGADESNIELKAKNPRDQSVFMDGKYILDPLKNAGDQIYRIGFTISNVTEEDFARTYDVKISNRKKHSNDLILSTVHTFDIQTGGAGHDESSDVGSSSTITGIVISIMLILLLITLVTILIMTYKHKKWCFAPQDPRPKPGYEGDVEQPLNDLNDAQTGGSSIIKPRS